MTARFVGVYTAFCLVLFGLGGLGYVVLSQAVRKHVAPVAPADPLAALLGGTKAGFPSQINGRPVYCSAWTYHRDVVLRCAPR